MFFVVEVALPLSARSGSRERAKILSLARCSNAGTRAIHQHTQESRMVMSERTILYTTTRNTHRVDACSRHSRCTGTCIMDLPHIDN